MKTSKERSKKKQDTKLLTQFKRGLEDIKAGRIRIVA